MKRKGEILGELPHELAMKYPSIGEARGVGLMWGLEIVGDGNEPDTLKTNAIVDRAFTDEHLILRSSRYGFGNVVKVRPSLTTTEDELVEIVERLDSVLASVN